MLEHNNHGELNLEKYNNWVFDISSFSFIIISKVIFMQKKAVIQVMIAMFLWGTIGIFRRYILLPSSVLAFSRGIIGALFIFVFLKIKKYKMPAIENKKLLWLLVLSGALMGLNWLLLFESYNYTSVAVATLCYYMQPVMIILVSPFLFNETLTKKKIICVVIAVIGMILVSSVVESEVTGILGIVLGLSAAVLYGTVVLMNKWLQGVDTYMRTMVQLLSAAVIMIPYMIITKDVVGMQMDLVSSSMLVFVGVLHTGVAYALYFGAIPKVKAQTLALFGYLDPVVAILLSALVLHEPLSLFGIIGAICILSSTLLSEW